MRCGSWNNFWMPWEAFHKEFGRVLLLYIIPVGDAGQWGWNSPGIPCVKEKVFSQHLFFWNCNTSFAELHQMGTPTEHGNCCFSGSIWLGKEFVWEKENIWQLQWLMSLLLLQGTNSSCREHPLPAPTAASCVTQRSHPPPQPKWCKNLLCLDIKNWFFFSSTNFPNCHKSWEFISTWNDAAAVVIPIK